MGVVLDEVEFGVDEAVVVDPTVGTLELGWLDELLSVVWGFPLVAVWLEVLV